MGVIDPRKGNIRFEVRRAICLESTPGGRSIKFILKKKAWVRGACWKAAMRAVGYATCFSMFHRLLSSSVAQFSGAFVLPSSLSPERGTRFRDVDRQRKKERSKRGRGAPRMQVPPPTPFSSSGVHLGQVSGPSGHVLARSSLSSLSFTEGRPYVPGRGKGRYVHRQGQVAFLCLTDGGSQNASRARMGWHR